DAVSAETRSHDVFLSLFCLLARRPPGPALFPYTTLSDLNPAPAPRPAPAPEPAPPGWLTRHRHLLYGAASFVAGFVLGFLAAARSEEHTSELQSRENLVCRLLLEKKNIPREVDRCQADYD